MPRSPKERSQHIAPYQEEVRKLRRIKCDHVVNCILMVVMIVVLTTIMIDSTVQQLT